VALKCAECGRKRDSWRWSMDERLRDIHDPTEEEIEEMVKKLKSLGVIFNIE